MVIVKRQKPGSPCRKIVVSDLGRPPNYWGFLSRTQEATLKKGGNCNEHWLCSNQFAYCYLPPRFGDLQTLPWHQKTVLTYLAALFSVRRFWLEVWVNDSAKGSIFLRRDIKSTYLHAQYSRIKNKKKGLKFIILCDKLTVFARPFHARRDIIACISQFVKNFFAFFKEYLGYYRPSSQGMLKIAPGTFCGPQERFFIFHGFLT